MARLVKSNLLSLENAIGILLAVLIIFDLSLEVPLSNALNTNVGMVFSIIIVVILFILVKISFLVMFKINFILF